MGTSKFKVLWIYQKMGLGKGQIEAGQLPSLCFKGRKKMLCVAAGNPVRIVVRDAVDFDKMREVWREGKPYAVQDAIKTFDGIAGRCGITKAADKLLGKARTLQEIEDEDAFENEEETAMTEDTKTPTTDGAAQAQEKKPVTKTVAAKKSAPAAKKSAPAKKTKTAVKKSVPAKKTKTAVKKSVPAAKKSVAKGDGLGREGSLTRFMNARLLKGESNDVISNAAKAKFPDSNTTEPSNVSWYRWNATRKGILKA